MNYELNSHMNNILTSVENETLTITINRPDKLNALNKTTLEEIEQAVDNGIRDSDVAAIIITGSGNKAFVAGADISEFLNYSKEQGRQLSAFGQNIFKKIELSPKPVVAAVNGRSEERRVGK